MKPPSASELCWSNIWGDLELFPVALRYPLSTPSHYYCTWKLFRKPELMRADAAPTPDTTGVHVHLGPMEARNCEYSAWHIASHGHTSEKYFWA